MKEIYSNNGSFWSKWMKKLTGGKGKQIPEPTVNYDTSQKSAGSKEENEIRNVLKKVIDPELEINIVDLGLIYKIEPGEKSIFVEMTLSTPACPIGDVIVQNVMDTLQQAYPGKEVDVNLVFEPAWHPGLLTEYGRQALEGKV